MNDELGNRMKEYYENVTRYFLPRRTYTIIRVDGRAWHQATKDYQKPFDKILIDSMGETAIYLCKNIQNAKLAYVQSDEISILLTDFDDINTQQFFGGNIQKICSVVASMTTSNFIANMVSKMFIPVYRRDEVKTDWQFDCRVFTIPSWIEVYNYMVWRNKDAARNSINVVAQSLYSHKELQGKSCDEMREMIFQKGINWAKYNEGLKNGRLITKKIEYIETMENPEGVSDIERNWEIQPAWVFTQDPERLQNLIPEQL